MDLGASRSVCRATLRWEAAFARAFQIQVGPAAGGPWTTIFSTTTGTGGVQTVDVAGTGQFVRMNGTQRGTGFGYSLWEFEVFVSGTAPPTSSPPPDGPVEPTDPRNPNFGPNTFVFDPSTPTSTIQSRLNTIFTQQETNQFGTNRFAVMFKPGTYTADVNLGFYEHVLGLGLSPDDVNLTGHVRVEAFWMGGNATQNFWRGAENLSVMLPAGVIVERYAVSQAAPYRRMHLRGAGNQIQLWNGGDGWSSGGFMADTKVDGRLRLAAAVVLPQQRVRQLGRIGVDHGLHRCDRGAAEPCPEPVAHCGRADPGGTGEAVPLCRRHRRVPGVRARAAQQLAGHHVVQPHPGRHLDLAEPVLRGTAGHDRRDHERGPGTGKEPAHHAGRLPPQPDAAGDPAGDRRAGHRARHTGSGQRHHRDDRRRRGRSEGRGRTLRRRRNELAGADGGRPGRLHREQRRQPDLVARRVLPRRRAGRRQGHGEPRHQQPQRHRRPHVAVAGRPRQRRRLDGQHRGHRPDRQRRQRHDVRALRRALPEVPDDLERQRRPDVLLPERNALRPAEPGRLDERLDPGYAAYKVADSVTTHQAWGLGSYCVFFGDPSVVGERGFEMPNRPGVVFTNMVIVSLGGVGTIIRVINNTGGPANATTQVVYLNSRNPAPHSGRCPRPRAGRERAIAAVTGG